jgi:hypothetical protein
MNFSEPQTYPAERSRRDSIEFDIGLVLDASRLFGEPLDPDKIAARVHQHHPRSGLLEIRDMVLQMVPSEDKLPASCAPPWCA